MENMKDQSLVAQRVICDQVNADGGILNVPLTRELLQSVSSSRHRYSQYLEEQKAQKKTDEQNRKRKQLQDDLDDCKIKRRRTEQDIKTLTDSADKVMEEGESSSCNAARLQSIFAKHNALRRAAKKNKKV